MKNILLVGLITLGATAFAASNTFKVNISQNSVIEGKTLKAGNYKISIENGNAVIKQGKETIEVPAREENEPNKVQSTELLYNDNSELHAIRLGGTHTSIVFEGAAPMHAGQ
jgi:hypothetical protein